MKIGVIESTIATLTIIFRNHYGRDSTNNAGAKRLLTLGEVERGSLVDPEPENTSDRLSKLGFKPGRHAATRSLAEETE
jgi:hypothetical protein